MEKIDYIKMYTSHKITLEEALVTVSNTYHDIKLDINSPQDLFDLSDYYYDQYKNLESLCIATFLESKGYIWDINTHRYVKGSK